MKDYRLVEEKTNNGSYVYHVYELRTSGGLEPTIYPHLCLRTANKAIAEKELERLRHQLPDTENK